MKKLSLFILLAVGAYALFMRHKRATELAPIQDEGLLA